MIEEQIMHLIKKFDEESIKTKFENSSKTLDDILRSQIPSRDNMYQDMTKKRSLYVPPSQTKVEIKEAMLLY